MVDGLNNYLVGTDFQRMLLYRRLADEREKKIAKLEDEVKRLNRELWMVKNDRSICPKCESRRSNYDRFRRIIKTLRADRHELITKIIRLNYQLNNKA